METPGAALVLLFVSSLLSSTSGLAGMASMVSMPVGRHHWLKSARHGTFLYNLRDTYIGQSLHHYGEWSEFEVRLFAQFVRRDDWTATTADVYSCSLV